MAIFWNIFIKTFSFFLAIVIIFSIITIILSFSSGSKNNTFALIEGDSNSTNTIAIIELNGLIINNNDQFSELINPFIISPNILKKYFDELDEVAPKIVIFSINSPGGTVSASNDLYEMIIKYKKNHQTEIIFHTNELLASGGYWVSSSADKIYANYGAIIGSIGVKGPDWFFYDKPKSISNGIFGDRIDTEDGIKVFTNLAGESKDIFNPFREPTQKEINHFQSLVNEIYNDFVRIISKERKIEISTITDDIGALIYSSKEAKELNLIDGEINLNNLIKKIINENKFNEYKILKKSIRTRSFLREIFSGNIYNYEINLESECLALRSSMSVILSYDSIGC